MENDFQKLFGNGEGTLVNPYTLADSLRRHRLLSTEEFFEVNHQKTPADATMSLFFDILPCKNKDDAMRCLADSVQEISKIQRNGGAETGLIQQQKKEAEICWNELDRFQRTMEMDEMKSCISEKATQNTLESKAYVNSFLLYGRDNDGDFMEIYPSEEQKKVHCNCDYKFYFGNIPPPVKYWPRGENGHLEGTPIALLPGAERYRINAEVNGKPMMLIYPQLTWQIAQGLKSKLECAGATVYVLRDENIDPFSFKTGRTTGPYFTKQVQAVDAVMVVGIHFNVGYPRNADKDTWTPKGATFDMQHANDVSAFIPGSYMHQYNELLKECFRFQFLRDIVTRKIEDSVELADCIVRALCNNLELQPGPALTNAVRPCPWAEGVYYRNLAYPRASKCPATYCFTAWIDHIDQFKKMVTGDYQDIVDGYYEGIMEYCSKKNYC